MFGRALLQNCFKNVNFKMRRKTSLVTVAKIDIKSPRSKSSFFSNSAFTHYRLLEEPKEFVILSKGIPRELELSREELSEEQLTELSTESSRGVSPPSFDEANYTFLKNKSLSELIRSLVVGKLCSIRWLVNHAEDLIKFSEKLYLIQPTYWIIRKTFFAQFCGGETDEQLIDVMNRLNEYGIKSILGLSVESDLPDEGFSSSTTTSSSEDKESLRMKYNRNADLITDMYLRCLNPASTYPDNFIAIKITGLIDPKILQNLTSILNSLDKSFNQFSINYKGKLEKSEFKDFLISIIGENDENKKKNNNNVIDNFLNNKFDKEGGGGDRLSIDKIEFMKMLSLDKSDITQFLLSNNNNNNNPKLSQEDIKDFEHLMNRLEKICELARERNVKLLIDAEQTYFQPAIDFISMKLSSKFNKSNHHDNEEGKREERDEGGGEGKRDAIVFNTYQMYLKDSFSRLKRDLELSRRGNFVFAAKLVRGAYMVGERLMAQKYGYPSPIHDNIEDTHKSYNEAVEFLLNELYKKRKENSIKNKNNKILAFFIASHNQESVILACNKMKQFGIDANSGVVNFGQLYGMSDHITYTLASHGYPIYKYIAYGKINEVIPFLIRRAQENSSIFDDRLMNERKLLWNELINRFKFRKTYELTN